jgi:hypothetical protein
MASPSVGDGRAKPDWGAPAPTARRGAAPPARTAAPARAGASARSGAPSKPQKAPKAQQARKAVPPKAQKGQKATARRPAPSRPPSKAPARRRTRGAFQRRYGIVHDTDGPHVRLGVIWFVLALATLIAGPRPAALIYGAAAALGAAQMAKAWRSEAPKPSVLMAALGAALVAVGACFGAGGAGLGMLGAVGLAFVGAAEGRSRNPRIADIGWTLQCALAPGVVAMSMVLLARLDQGSAIGLLLLASAYETGDYLIGSGSANPFEGPGAGAAGIVVITFILSTLPISALSFGQAWALGGSMAILAPVGQLLASALLPSAATPASGLRRLDSLLLAAPIWAWSVGLVLK